MGSHAFESPHVDDPTSAPPGRGTTERVRKWVTDVVSGTAPQTVECEWMGSALWGKKSSRGGVATDEGG